jgi:VCBS repeat protein/IPT/TIG domain-containing protein
MRMIPFAVFVIMCLTPLSGADAQCPQYGNGGPPPAFPAHNGTRGVAAADFDGDGKLDVVVANQVSSDISFLMGDGVGGLGAPINVLVGASPVAVAAADMNGDGRTDVVVANSGASSVSVVLNNGGGSFAPAVSYAVGSGPAAIAIADFNGDGRPDVATANSLSNNVSILTNNGSGAFGGPVNYSVQTGPVAIRAGDFDGDGKADLAVGHGSSFLIFVLLNNGTGAFLPPTNFAGPNFLGRLAIADFNGDGKLDIGVSTSGGNIAEYYGNGAGSFALGFGPVFTGPPAGADAAAGDINGDGVADLAVVGSSLAFVIGNQITNNFATGHFSIALGDFNGDGSLDIVGADSLSGVLLVLSASTCPTISTIIPNSGFATGGQTVMVNGNLLAGAKRVTFGGTAAAIAGNTPNSITVTTPAHSAGPVNVVVNSAGGTTTVTNGFTFFGIPSVTSVLPAVGLAAGGQSVTITGANLNGVTTVTFGGVSATITSSTPASLTVVTPAHATGAVDIVITSPGGSTTAPAAFAFFASLADIPALSVWMLAAVAVLLAAIGVFRQ